jgi:hypothetical protein
MHCLNDFEQKMWQETRRFILQYLAQCVHELTEAQSGKCALCMCDSGDVKTTVFILILNSTFKDTYCFKSIYTIIANGRQYLYSPTSNQV